MRWTALFVALSLAGCKSEPEDGGTSSAPEDAGAAAVKVKPEAPAKTPVAADEGPPGPPVRAANPVELKTVAKRLSERIEAASKNPKEPWVLAHGLLAFGKDLKTTKKGKLAVDVIVHDFVEAHELDGKLAYYSFPTKKGDIPVEPHNNLMIKSMLSAGVPLDHRFPLKNGKSVTLDRLVADAERVFVMPVADRDWKNFAWTFDAFLMARGDRGYVQAGDKKIDLKELALRTISRVEAEQAFLVEYLEENRPDKVKKRKQAIFGHTCGGLHLIQAGIHAAGYLKDANVTRMMQKQLAIVLFRWDAERRIYRDFLAKTEPAYAMLILIQELKFYGHLLETLAMAKTAGLVEADSRMQLEVARIAGDLVDTAARIEPLYDKMDELKKVRRQSYYDLVGDAAHAIRGLRWSLDAFFPEPKDNEKAP